MYAHVTNGVIDQIGQPPQLVWDGTRWYDLRDRSPDSLANLGWYTIVNVDRPPDTTTTTWDLSHAMIDGAPTEVWTERPWTADELASQEATVNEGTIRSRAETALTVNDNYLALPHPVTNAQAAQQIDVLTKECSGVIRLLLRRLESIDGT